MVQNNENFLMVLTPDKIEFKDNNETILNTIQCESDGTLVISASDNGTNTEVRGDLSVTGNIDVGGDLTVNGNITNYKTTTTLDEDYASKAGSGDQSFTASHFTAERNSNGDDNGIRSKLYSDRLQITDLNGLSGNGISIYRGLIIYSSDENAEGNAGVFQFRAGTQNITFTLDMIGNLEVSGSFTGNAGFYQNSDDRLKHNEKNNRWIKYN